MDWDSDFTDWDSFGGGAGGGGGGAAKVGGGSGEGGIVNIAQFRRHRAHAYRS